MQSPDNLFARANGSEKRCRPALHFPWKPGTAGFRIMALLDDGSTMLVCLVQNHHEIRLKGEAAANEVVTERKRYLAGLRANGDASIVRSNILSLYTERWVGTLTNGSWQTMSCKDGGFCNSFRKLEDPPTLRGRRRKSY